MFSETELSIARHMQANGLFSERLLAAAVLREAEREREEAQAKVLAQEPPRSSYGWQRK